MNGLEKLDHIDDIDEVTRENFKLPLDCLFMALSAFAVTCQGVQAATMFLTRWAATTKRHIHTITIADAFDAIEDIRKNGVEMLRTSPDRIIEVLPANARLSLILGIGGTLVSSVAYTIQHAIGHMMAISPELAFAGHLHQLMSLPVVQHTVDDRLKKMAVQLDESEPREWWPELHDMANKSLPVIIARKTVDARLRAALTACVKTGALMAGAAEHYNDYADRLKKKAEAEVAETRKRFEEAAEAEVAETRKRFEEAAERGVQQVKEGEPASATPFDGDSSSPTSDGSQTVH